MSDLPVHLPIAGQSARVALYLDAVLLARDVRGLDDVVAHDYVLHGVDGDLFGREGARLAVAELRRAMPDIEGVVQVVASAGDWTVRRYRLRGTHGGPLLGVPATGRTLRIDGVSVDRLHGGVLVESWRSVDTLLLLHQIGCTILPPGPGRDGAARLPHTDTTNR